jgi:opacity protein-like surface antigen
MMLKKIQFLLSFLLCAAFAQAQDSSLLSLLNDSASTQPMYVTGTFKATQIINTPTVEAPARKSLQFMIMHRFGKLNEGAYALFGLDNAEIRFALDYGITDRLAIGIGRSSYEKVYDASLKYKLLRQREHGMPFSASIYGLIANTTLRYDDKTYLNTKYRTMYTTQLLLASKLTPRLSLQLTPAWIHFNLVPTKEDQNDVFAVGIGGRMKVTKRMSINAEYNYLPSGQLVSTKQYNSLSGGLDLETGGHVFQLVFTNSVGMIAPYYLAKTQGSWGNGDIYFGFNITRIFNFKK